MIYIPSEKELRLRSLWRSNVKKTEFDENNLAIYSFDKDVSQEVLEAYKKWCKIRKAKENYKLI